MPLTKQQEKLRGREITNMTDAQLRDWIKACDTMEQEVKPNKARRSWTKSRTAAQAELEKRSAADW